MKGGPDGYLEVDIGPLDSTPDDRVDEGTQLPCLSCEARGPRVPPGEEHDRCACFDAGQLSIQHPASSIQHPASPFIDPLKITMNQPRKDLKKLTGFSKMKQYKNLFSLRPL